MTTLTYLINAQQADAKNELDGKVVTRPTLSVSDGLATIYACDVDIGIRNQQGNDQSANLLNVGAIGSILHDVPIAKGNMDVVYADVGAAVRLRRTASGRYEIIGFSKEMPGTYIRIPVNLDDFTFGRAEDLSISSRPLAYIELIAFGGYGTVPYGATATFQGPALVSSTTPSSPPSSPPSTPSLPTTETPMNVVGYAMPSDYDTYFRGTLSAEFSGWVISDATDVSGALIVGKAYTIAPGLGKMDGWVVGGAADGRMVGAMRLMTSSEVVAQLSRTTTEYSGIGQTSVPGAVSPAVTDYQDLINGVNFDVHWSQTYSYFTTTALPRTWTANDPGLSSQWGPMAWSEPLGLFACVAVLPGQLGGDIMTSSDGVTWTPHFNINVDWSNGILWSDEEAKFVVHYLPQLQGGATFLGHVIPWHTKVSSNGSDWVEVPNSPDVEWHGFARSPELGFLLGHGTLCFPLTDGGTAAPGLVSGISYDGGITWLLSNNLPHNSESANGVWNGAAWSADLALFVIAGEGDTFLTSPDGATWTTRAVPPGGWQSVSWSPDLGLFAAGGCALEPTIPPSNFPYVNAIMTSPDGVNWTAIEHTLFPVFLAGGWIAERSRFELGGYTDGPAGSHHIVYTSTDGVTWDLQPGGGPWEVYAPSLDLFVGPYGYTDNVLGGSPVTYYWPTQTTTKAYATSTLHVATTGSDSNPGTSSSPFLTIHHASTVAGPGDVILVAPGTYTGGFQTTSSGSSGAPIRYVSATGWGARIVPPAASSSEYAWDNRGGYVTIDGFDVDGSIDPSSGTKWTVGIRGAGTSNIVRNCHVHHIARSGNGTNHGGAGILMDSYYGFDDLHAINNMVDHIGPSSGVGGSYYHGIHHTGTGSIKGNIVCANTGAGIHMWHDIHDCVVANNSSFANGDGYIFGGGDFVNTSGPADNCVFANNIAYDNTGIGFDQQGSYGTANVWTNNLSYSNGANWRLNAGTHSNDVSANPLFVDYRTDGSGNYRLQATSPAIGAGTATYAPVTDFGGTAYATPPSIGVYE